MLEPTPLLGGIPGGMELVVILLIAVLLFGANKIPKLARSTGEAMGEFQKGREEVEQELQDMRQGGQRNPESEAASTGEETSVEETPSDAEAETEPSTESESSTE